ncbi:hypothetical protein AbraIFM66951_011948 [Aspergillus brasiliensis]|uniref:Xylanolytic transcriptional activator regulatory domain-containing protein n=1 Tax=Aspergillus brasiliensis TaxID=319629 RepID=A0A9W5YXB8_9EURO|nr:hypothetical protein AbraCBS73388_011668 [Aspergillus brasiliensis]GKZ48190.1 hypothetical protein AbraIFM66951_011948 [Aspergillus brasiliensis]
MQSRVSDAYFTNFNSIVSRYAYKELYVRTLEYNQLPSYIESAPAHITKDALEFLSYKHAFSIPNDSVRQALWTAYWKYAHPFIPVLDQIEMSKSIQGCGEKISLLLYQCVMLVGQLFLIAHEGPRGEFRDSQELFASIRALYDLDWETRPLIILQALILMTFFPQKVTEPKGQAYFVRHAVSIAYNVGLHRDPTSFYSEASVQHFRKRLWWSLFIRERTLLLDDGTPWMIDDTDYDVPMIEIDDFCLPDVCHNVGTQSPLVDVNCISRQRKIAIMWVERAKLAVIMGRLSPLSIRIPESNSSIAERPVLQSGVAQFQKSLHDTAIALERWQRDVDPETDLDQLSSPASWAEDRELYLQCATLKLLYHTVKFQLAVLLDLSKTPTQTVQFPRTRTRQEVNESCNAIMQITKDLRLSGCTAHLPLYGTSVLRPVLIWAILNGVLGRHPRQASGFNPLQFDIGRVDSYEFLFKAFILCDTE